MKIKFTKQELSWIERTSDIETSRLFNDFNNILKVYGTGDEKAKELLDNQIKELIELYTFLKTLRCKLELWDCRYDVDTEIEIKDKEEKK